MKTFFTTAILTVLLVGCVDTGPVISKSKMGNLELNVYGPEGKYPNAELYLDGIFIGNLTRHMPVIYAKRGERVVRVEATGFKPYEKSITVLGEPNHQVLNIFLEKE
ncbi:MAG: PEGA domain-containing protein [Planctomycetota bacterium]|jgi:hypothetical protein